jgi:signal transduction histidine kinase
MDYPNPIARAYRFLVEVGHALRHAPGEAELAEEICRIAVEVAGYRLAWVGYRQVDALQSVRVVAHFGDESGYLERAKITWAEDERGSGPTGVALRTGKAQVAQNIASDPRLAPWREDAIARGYASSAALPLGDGDTSAVLNVYAAEPDAFDEEELELLERVALDLERGILGARGRHELARLQTGTSRLGYLDAMTRSAAMLAHDMNNYLAVSRLCIESLGLGAEPRSKALLDEATSALDRAIDLNKRMVALSREAPAPRAVFELDAAVGEQAPELRRMLGPERDISLSLGAPGCEVEMDRAGFERVLANLAVNAREAMPRGGNFVLETERTHLRHPLPARWLGGLPREYVVLRARDTGVGIEPAIRDRIFEPFFSTKGERGSGLGLASVYSVVREAGGLLAVDSAPGAGSTFEVLLPLRVAGPGGA